MTQFCPYTLTTLLSSAIIFITGVGLSTVRVPKEPGLRNYRISRRFLAAAYMILAAIGFAGVFWNSQIHLDTVIAPLQALLFTFALITLINRTFVTFRRLLFQFLLIGFIIAASPVNSFVLKEPLALVAHLAQAAYYGLYVYYVWIFFREYLKYIKRADNFYAGDEKRLLRWVLHVFITAALIGAIAGMLKENNAYFLTFIVVYTVIYVWLAIKYINYATLFSRFEPVVSVSEKEKSGGQGVADDHIGKALEKWLSSKEFLNQDITLESLVSRLNINRTYISRYINSQLGMSFRQWIGTLRIKEAQRIMETDPEKPIMEVAEAVGICNQSSFCRQFRNVTGMTPGGFRETVRKNSCPK